MRIKRLCVILLISIAVLICLGICYKIGSPSKEVGKDVTFEMADNWEDEFYIEEISDEVFQKMQGASYKENCTIPIESLRYVHILHCDFNNESREGELVCNEAVAQDLLEIFKEWYKSGYQIEKVRLVDEYGAVDEDSMADNNSSAFNYRTISYTDIISAHGMGVAVDINPLYNPYVKEVDGRTSVEPANGAPYVDRTQDIPHKIDHDDLCYKLFVQHGFQWGGDWTDSKDYQHFEKTID